MSAIEDENDAPAPEFRRGRTIPRTRIECEVGCGVANRDAPGVEGCEVETVGRTEGRSLGAGEEEARREPHDKRTARGTRIMCSYMNGPLYINL